MGKKRVIVAMSGGVDSSVAAALLKDQGYDVVGVTMQIWQPDASGSCCGLSGIEDARRVARLLKIPHYVLNFKQVFQEKIISPFCAEYSRGRTPNPCVRCNQYIKFDALLKRARQLDADYVATGHYARVQLNQRSKRFVLKKGRDSHKDQSYFLYALSQAQLRRILMPLGELTKQQVRGIAKKKGLPVADKPGSQEICFIPDNDYGRFLRQHSPKTVQPGPIVNREGQVIGRHQGIAFYTIGQRKGIGIAYKEPLYVAAIEKKNNTIIVGSKDEVYAAGLVANQLNFIYIKECPARLRVKVRVRYQHQVASATVFAEGKKAVRICFDQPQWAVTPGQAAVMYQGDCVVGGGTINKVFS
ncbi:MAG: tRNA 2-thiouridine(34) synthase MnmA [Candidatus Omnitrophota bacterium]